jgi:hypothetical protein
MEAVKEMIRTAGVSEQSMPLKGQIEIEMGSSSSG